MSALNLPSASDLERLERRLRSFSQRLEDVEEQLDELEPRAVGALRRKIAAKDEPSSRSRRKPTLPNPRPEALDELTSTRGSGRCRGPSGDVRRRLQLLVAERLAAGRLGDDQDRRRRRSPSSRAAAKRAAVCMSAASPSSTGRRRAGGVEDVEAGDGPRPRRLAELALAAAPPAPGRGGPPRRRRRRAPTRRAPRDRRPASPGRSSGAQRRAGPDPDRPPHPELGQVGEHQRRARAAHPGRLDGQLAPPGGRLARVAPEAARVVAHLRLLEQLLGQRQRPPGVADEDRVGGDRGGGSEARRHRGGEPRRACGPRRRASLAARWPTSASR